MIQLPKSLESAIAEFGKLPGVGRRGAERMAFGLLEGGAEQTAALARALSELASHVGRCAICGYFTEHDDCPLCTDTARETALLCVVEHPLDVVAFERAGGFCGVYHVLGGVLSPLKGATPEDLRIDELVERLESGAFGEVILATSPSVDGDATAIYLAQTIRREGLRLTRIGRGVPMGGSLELADGGTLRMALEGRREF